MNSLPVKIVELLRLTHGTTATGGTQLISGFTILDYLWTPYVGLQATTYDHRQDTASVEQPKLIPHCDQDLHAALLVWQNALRKLEAAHAYGSIWLPPELLGLIGHLKRTKQVTMDIHHLAFLASAAAT